MPAILDLVFSDLFVSTTRERSFYKTAPDSRQVVSLPAWCEDEFSGLRRVLLANIKWPSFRHEWVSGDHRERLRVTPFRTAEGEPLLICRRALLQRESHVLSLSDLGFPAAVVRRLLEVPLRQGLLLIMGSKGAGKTTARAAFLRDYITKHGGVCMALDAPIEIDLDGPCGGGHILQQEISSELEMGAALRGTLRSSSDIISPGEVTRDEVAAEVLDLATSGQLVPTTFHAEDLISGLARFNRNSGGRNDAFADGLSAAVHLSLSTEPLKQHRAVGRSEEFSFPGEIAPPQRLLSVTPLFIVRENQDHVRSHIRGGQFHQLTSEIDRQRRLMLAGGLP